MIISFKHKGLETFFHTGSGAGMLGAPFGGQLFGPGQPLDASKYYVILPDAIGTGKSTKPSDGLRAKFPQYNYDDMVNGQYRLVTEHLGVKHLRVVIGNSMGGMQTWMWAQRWPGMIDLAVPMASMPVAMSGRNWMMRRLIIDSIRNDPEWMEGNYTREGRCCVERPFDRPLCGRCERPPLPVGFIWRLRSFQGFGEHPRAGVGGQLGR